MRWNSQFNIFGQSFSQSVEKPQRGPSLCSVRMRANCLPLWTAWESSSMCGLPFLKQREMHNNNEEDLATKEALSLSFPFATIIANHWSSDGADSGDHRLSLSWGLVVCVPRVHFKNDPKPQTALGSLLSLWRFDRTVHCKERRSNPHGPRSQLIYPLRYLAFVIECSLRTLCTH